MSVSSPSSKNSIQLHLLGELSLKLQTLLKTDNIWEDIVTTVQNKFHYYSFSIWSIAADGAATLRAQSGAYNKFIKPGFTIKGEGILGRVVQTKRPYLSNNVAQDPSFTNLSLPIETRSQLSIPVVVEGNVAAVLTVESNSTNAFDDEDKMTFEALSVQLSIAFVNTKLYQEIKSFNKRLQQTVEERTQELRGAHAKILEQQRLLQKENKVLKSLVQNDKKSEDGLIIGSSPAILNVLNMVDKIAPTNATVLIQGESGTGKELIARRLHLKSDRNQKPYVSINCGALQETLLESELFGHEKGSFTGAVSQKMGLVETADGGTLFLDEIGEMSLSIQSKLLRFLQEGEIYRIGGKRPLKVDVRIISATNRDLEHEVKESRFREDLFYRLNAITLRVPPLRKRKEDIRPLIEHFLKHSKFGGAAAIKRVEPAVFEVLQNYEWPGNIRELQNTIERLKILSENGEIGLDDIPFNIRMPKARANFDKEGNSSPEFAIAMSLDDLERQHILKILSYHQGNKTKTALTLGVTIKTLYNKLHKYQLIRDAGGLEPH